MRPELVHADEWQEAEFSRLGIGRRDPMYQTLAVLLEIDACEDEDAVRAACVGAEASGAVAPGTRSRC